MGGKNRLGKSDWLISTGRKNSHFFNSADALMFRQKEISSLEISKN
jgi:hypothetical protein